MPNAYAALLLRSPTRGPGLEGSFAPGPLSALADQADRGLALIPAALSLLDHSRQGPVISTLHQTAAGLWDCPRQRGMWALTPSPLPHHNPHITPTITATKPTIPAITPPPQSSHHPHHHNPHKTPTITATKATIPAITPTTSILTSPPPPAPAPPPPTPSP